MKDFRKKNFCEKKLYSRFLTGAITFVFLIILSVNYINDYNGYSLEGDYEKLENWTNYVVGSNNIDSNGSKYKVVGEDPYLMLDLSSINEKINGIKVTTKEINKKIQIYYYNPNDSIQEEKSEKFTDEKIVEFVSENNWNNYRIDIDNDFEIEEIQYIANVKRVYNKINIGKYFIAFFVDIIFAFLIGYINPVAILLSCNLVNYIKYIIIACVTLLNLLVSFWGEMLIARLHKVPYINQYRIFLIFAGVEIVMIFILFWKNVQETLHIIAFMLILILGMVNIYATPVEVGIAYDDEIHYARTLFIADGMTGSVEQQEKRLIDKYAENIYQKNIYTKAEREKSLLEGHEVAQYKGERKLDSEDGWQIYSISYLPAAIGIYFGKLINLDFSIIFKLGKLINLGCYAFIIAWAIKILHQKGKMLCLSIALIPTNLFQASSYSYDWWVVALLLLAFAKLFSLLQEDKKITILDYLKIILIAFLAIMPKAVYVVLFIPFIFVPTEKLENAIVSRIIGISGMIAGICTFMLPLFANVASGTPSGDMRGGSDVNATEQFVFVLTHPLRYLKVLCDFLWDYLSIKQVPNYTISMGYYGIGALGISIMVIVLIVAIIDNPRNFMISKRKMIIYRSIVVLSGLLTVIFIATAFYLAYTAVQCDTILGCQSRYILPVLFPGIYCLFYNHRELKDKIKNNFYNIIILIMSIVWLYNMYVLLIAKY